MHSTSFFDSKDILFESDLWDFTIKKILEFEIASI